MYRALEWKRRSTSWWLIVFSLLLCLTGKASCSLAGDPAAASLQQSTTEGFALYSQGHYLEAAPRLEKLLAAYPEAVEARRAVANCYFQLGSQDRKNQKALFRQAQKHARILIQSDKETVDGDCIMGVTLFYEDERAAIPYLEKVVHATINTSISQVIKNRATFYGLMSVLGSAYGVIKDYEKCLFYYRKFVSYCAHDAACVQHVPEAQRLIPRLERLLAAKKAYEANQQDAAAAPDPSAPSIRGTLTKTHPANGQAARTVPSAPAPAVPSPAPPRQAKSTTLQKEYEKAKDEMDHLFKERRRKIEMLTG